MRVRTPTSRLRAKIWIQGALEDMQTNCNQLDKKYLDHHRRVRDEKPTQHGSFARMRREGILPDSASRPDDPDGLVSRVNAENPITKSRLYLPLWTFAEHRAYPSVDQFEDFYRSLPRAAGNKLLRVLAKQRRSRALSRTDFKEAPSDAEWENIWATVTRHVQLPLERLSVLTALCRERPGPRGCIPPALAARWAREIEVAMQDDPVFSPHLEELFSHLRENIFPVQTLFERGAIMDIVMDGEVVATFNLDKLQGISSSDFEAYVRRSVAKEPVRPIFDVPSRPRKRK